MQLETPDGGLQGIDLLDLLLFGFMIYKVIAGARNFWSDPCTSQPAETLDIA